MGARDFSSPSIALKILPSGLLAGEALEELIQADSFGFVGHATCITRHSCRSQSIFG